TLASMADAKWAQPSVELGMVAYRRARLTKDQKAAAPLAQAALDAATKALGLDPRNADALELAGTIEYYRVQRGLIADQHDIDRATSDAEQRLQQAVAVNPRQATAWNALSLVDYGKQRVADSYSDARKAYEADAYLRAAPDILWRLYATSYDLEQFANASRWCDEGTHRFPQN